MSNYPAQIAQSYTWQRVRPMTMLLDYFILAEVPSTATAASVGPYIVAVFDLSLVTTAFTLRLPVQYRVTNGFACIRYVEDGTDNVIRYNVSGTSHYVTYTGQVIQATRAVLEVWSSGEGLAVEAPAFYLPIGHLTLPVSAAELAGRAYATTLCINTTGTTGGFEDYATTCYF